MDNTGVVCGLEGGRGLFDDQQRPVRSQSAMSPELSRKRGTIDELHDKVSKVGGVVAGDLAVVEDRHDTRMADGTYGSGFPAEAFAKLVVVGEFGAQELDGDGSPENSIDSTPDLTPFPRRRFARQADSGRR
jgi:hypothetical protein